MGDGFEGGLDVGLEAALGAERASLERRVAYRGGAARCGADRVSGYSSAARCTGAIDRGVLVVRLGLSGVGFCGIEFLGEPSDREPVPDRDTGCRVVSPLAVRVVTGLVVLGRVVVGREVVGRAGADLAEGVRTGRTGLVPEMVFESAEPVVVVSVGLVPRHALRSAPTSPAVSSRHCPMASLLSLTGPMAMRSSFLTGAPTAASIRRTWRLRPSLSVSSRMVRSRSLRWTERLTCEALVPPTVRPARRSAR